MLTELRIKNVAVVDHQVVSFGAGLNVITGETGAGKSIILDSVQLILGGRGSTDFIRAGEEGLEVEAHFDLSGLPEGSRRDLPEIAEADELVISREISKAGRNRILINGRLGSVSLLEEISARLITVCGQHHHIRLLDPRFHLELIDGFASHEKLIAAYSEHHAVWKAAATRLSAARASSEKSILRTAELEHIMEELGPVRLTESLRDDLEASTRRLGNAEKVIASSERVESLLDSDRGLRHMLSSLAPEVASLAKLDDAARPLLSLFESAKTTLLEFEADVRRYRASVSVDEEALEKLRDELATIAKLERRYRTNCAGLVQLKAQAEKELKTLSDGANIDALENEVATAFRRMEESGAKLTESREKAGQKLARSVERELSELGMEHARMRLELTKSEYTQLGCDKVQMIIAPNKGDTFRPLKQVASGGELSRIMLVLKKILRDRTGVNVLVFDEVDAGISGSIARAVGEKLKALSEHSQVICITHLPQIASLSDRHILVQKSQGTRTSSLITELSSEDKVEEIARMLAGYTVTPAARESARELIASKPR